MQYVLILISILFLVSLARRCLRQAFRAIHRLLMMVAVAGAALLIGSVAGTIIAALSDGQSPWPLSSGVLIGFGAAVWLWRRYEASGATPKRVIEPPQRVAPVAVPPVDQTPLDRAWARTERLTSPAIVAAARARCDALLAAAAADPLDMTLLDWAVFVRDRIPALIAAVEQVARAATPDARRALHCDLERDLTAIGIEAEARLAAHGQRAVDALVTLRRHLAMRLEIGGPA